MDYHDDAPIKQRDAGGAVKEKKKMVNHIILIILGIVGLFVAIRSLFWEEDAGG